MVVRPETISSNGHALYPKELPRIKNLADYYDVFRSGEVKPINARQLAWMALSDPAPVLNNLGFISLGAFTERSDKHQVFGIAYTINAIATAFQVAAANPYHDRGIVFWGESGSGKSNLVDVIVKSVEAKASQIPYLFGIENCPINEDPLNLLNLKNAKSLRSEGLEPQKDLCPDCQRKYCHHSDKELERLVLAPLQFNSRTGEQISRIQASSVQDRMHPEGREKLNQEIKNAGRGLLIFDEIGDFDPRFLHEQKDLVRDGDFKVNGLVYPMDLLVIGHTTQQEWKSIVENKDHKPVAERYQPISVPYNIDTLAEVQIYHKTLDVLPNSPHIAPDTVDTWAELAVSTRLASNAPLLNAQYNVLKSSRKELLGDLADLSDAEAKRRIKVRLYRGDLVPGFRQADTKNFQTQGVNDAEGLQGLSPVSARSLLTEMITNNGECFSALQLFRIMEAKLEKDTKVELLDKSNWNAVIDPVRKRWESDLKVAVLSAFRDDMAEKIQIKTANYLEECDYLLNKGPDLPIRKTVQGEEIPVNLALMEDTEKEIFGRVLGNDERISILTGLPSSRGVSQDKTSERAKFDDGIQKMVREEGSFNPEEVLKVFPQVDEKQIAYVDEAEERMINEKGFCSSCAQESLLYVSQMLRRPPKK